MMGYKGYTGVAEVDEEAGVIVGRVLGLRDVITFQGETVAQVRKAFEDSVDDYLEFCAERGESPERPYSGKFIVRVKPELHRALATSAEASGLSLNTLVETVLSEKFLSHAADTVGRVLIGGLAAGMALGESLGVLPGAEPEPQAGGTSRSTRHPKKEKSGVKGARKKSTVAGTSK